MFYFLSAYIFHWVPEKAIWLGGHTLSWDARCSGIYIGFGIGILYHVLVLKRSAEFPTFAVLVFKIILLIPLFTDALTIISGLRTPSNDVRYLTGLLFGEAFSWILVPAFTILVFPTKESDSEGWRGRDAIKGPISILVVIAGAFILRFWESIFAYLLLEALAVFGFLSLFTILIWSGVNLIRRDDL